VTPEAVGYRLWRPTSARIRLQCGDALGCAEVAAANRVTIKNDQSLALSRSAPPEYAEYPATETVQTRQALVVLPAERGAGPQGGRWLAATGRTRTVVAGLASPLGDRVVVDLDASR
jgi:hypothetical protein